MNYNAPIQNLQKMLHVISYIHHEIPGVPITGSFGEATREGVRSFQKMAELPVTGVVDYDTWSAIDTMYQDVKKQLTLPTTDSLYALFVPEMKPDKPCLLLYPVQGMFSALGERLTGIQIEEPNGMLDPCTQGNIRWLQKCCGQEETGILDPVSWNGLCRLYEIMVMQPIAPKVVDCKN